MTAAVGLIAKRAAEQEADRVERAEKATRVAARNAARRRKKVRTAHLETVADLVVEQLHDLGRPARQATIARMARKNQRGEPHRIDLMPVPHLLRRSGRIVQVGNRDGYPVWALSTHPRTHDVPSAGTGPATAERTR